MSPVLSLRDVHVEFPLSGGRVLRAVQGVDLEIPEGGIVTLVGESGCGKSTLGKVLLGVLPPTRGTVHFGEVQLWARGFRWTRELRLQVQVVHQDSYASLNPVHRVQTILGGPLRAHGLVKGAQEAGRAVRELLERVGLTPADYFAAKHPFQLSGGQRQRVALARALMLRPRLILADEPVSGVDASVRLSILELMKELNREEGIAFAYITHDLATARFFGAGHPMGVMYLGRLVEWGELGALLDRPRHPYLKALLAALPPPDPLQARQVGPLPLKSLDLPDATRPPSGCPFHPRCLLAEARCEAGDPPALLDGVACHLAQAR